MKNSRRKIAGRCFLMPFFRIRENFFQSFNTKFLSLLYMISLAYGISHCLSANHYPELRCVICTGVTLFALVLHLNCTALSQSESSNFFHVYYHYRNSKDFKDKNTNSWKKSGRNLIYRRRRRRSNSATSELCMCGRSQVLVSLRIFCEPKTDVFDSFEADDDVA